MNYLEYTHLVAERSALRSMLARIPDDAVIDRMSTEARLKKLEGQIAAVETAPRKPTSARLTFQGRPVVASHGVFAEFGAKAMDAFTETVAVLAAAQSGPLADMGPIPNREQNQLLITGTAVGSFGFEVEERQLSQRTLFEEDSAVAVALGQTVELLRCVAASDDELTEAYAGLDPRVIKAIRGFLDVLASNEAVCTLEFGSRSFGFRDVAQVRRGTERLADDNIHEETQTFFGEFQGVLPMRRTFEFKVAADDDVIVGKIAGEIESPDDLNRHLRQTVTISLTAMRIGSGRVRYVLHEMPAWTDSAQESAE